MVTFVVLVVRIDCSDYFGCFEKGMYFELVVAVGLEAVVVDTDFVLPVVVDIGSELVVEAEFVAFVAVVVVLVFGVGLVVGFVLVVLDLLVVAFVVVLFVLVVYSFLQFFVF
jgi:hypothetical protein